MKGVNELNNLFDIVSNDYISTYIALAGFVISIANSIYLINVNSFKISLIIKSYAICSNLERHPLYFELAIENNSRISLAVSRMYLNVGEKKYEFKWEKERVGHFEFKTNGVLTEEYSIYSETLPQVIQGYGAIGGFFYVETESNLNEGDFMNSEMSIEIHTNRGKKCFKTDLSKLPVHI